MHNVSVKGPTTAHVQTPRTPLNPPLVTIHSPSSVHSPSRSPRLSNLLHALRDVIGDEPEEEFEERTYVEEPINLKAGDSDYATVIDINHSLQPNDDDDEHNRDSSGSIPETTPKHSIKPEDETLGFRSSEPPAETEPEFQPLIHTTVPSPETSSQPQPPSVSDLLSPVDLSHLHFGPFALEGSEEDINYAATAIPMQRSPTSPLKSTFGILSSPFATASSRVLSPRLSAFISRSPQSPFATSPVADDNDVPPDADLSLDSPAEQSFTTEAVPSEEYVVVEPEAPEEDAATEESDSEEEEEEEEEESIEATSLLPWDHNGDSPEVYLGMSPPTFEEVDDALRSTTQTPVNYLSDAVEFDETEPTANSTVLLPGPSHFAESEDSVEDLGETEPMDSSSESIRLPYMDDSAESSDSVKETVDCDQLENFSQPDNSSNSETSDILQSSAADIDSAFNCGDDSADEDSELDDTVQLAYLTSPTVVINKSDTLNSLYDQYGGDPKEDDDDEVQATANNIIIESPVQELSCTLLAVDDVSPMTDSPLITPLDDPLLDAAEIESQGTTPVRSAFIHESIHERDFTSPPTMPITRGRSGTIVAVDSPRSEPPPIPTSTRPSSRISPSSVWSPDSGVSEVQEAVVSRKVAFGFRKPLAPTEASALASQRLSKRESMFNRPPPVRPPIAPSEPADASKNTSPISAPIPGLRPLRLSTIISSQPSSAPSRKSVFSVNSYRTSRRKFTSDIYVVYKCIIRLLLFSQSFGEPRMFNICPALLINTLKLLSSSQQSSIPENIRNTQFTTDDIPSPLSSTHLRRLKTFSVLYDDSPRSAPLSRRSSWQINPVAELDNPTENEHTFSRPFSRASEPSYIYEEDEEELDDTAGGVSDEDRDALRLPVLPHSAPIIDHQASVARTPTYAVEAPKPTLMFAIASDDVKQVQRVLETGDAGPNDSMGPQSALEFALTNERLTNKMEIVKTLLAFGADPKAIMPPEPAVPVQEAGPGSPGAVLDAEKQASPPHPSLMDSLDPATRYYVERADAPQARGVSALIQRSFFRPLTRVRYELVGQDRALEQLFKDLSIHSRQLSVTPIVVLLCVGSLLDVPTHTVDMTTIHSAQDLWKSYSMSPYDSPSSRTLAEFLCDNEGKRCVVVLDEIEKTHGESPLWALLMPWEHGRCTFESNGRLVDVRNVVWLGTSNIGQDLVFEHHNARSSSDEVMSKGEYAELMALLRPRVSERLGTSMLSRVTTVLPFVPFTSEERQAICYEALHTIAGDIVQTLAPEVVDTMVKGALTNYTAAEGARSLYRAVSSQLVDTI
ncbi:hypothetical protein H0H92_004543 [Tricholoma furcatifolium]|nr:hypothetical protein H0H92_004543 [Tricholoma furcatifolium]